jgi:hypothetical protein
MAQGDFAQWIERAFVEVVTNKAEQRHMGKMELPIPKRRFQRRQ